MPTKYGAATAPSEGLLRRTHQGEILLLYHLHACHGRPSARTRISRGGLVTCLNHGYIEHLTGEYSGDYGYDFAGLGRDLVAFANFSSVKYILAVEQ